MWWAIFERFVHESFNGKMTNIAIIMAKIKYAHFWLAEYIPESCRVWCAFVNFILKNWNKCVWMVISVYCECRTVPVALTWMLYQRGTTDILDEGWLSLFLTMASKKIIQISRGITYVFLVVVSPKETTVLSAVSVCLLVFCVNLYLRIVSILNWKFLV